MSELNTRRFPRTVLEAFGPDAETARPIHGPYRRAPGWASAALLIIGVAALVGSLYVVGRLMIG